MFKKILLLLIVTVVFTPGQNIIHDLGFTAEIFKGDLYVLGTSGTQTGVRLSIWPKSWYNIGFAGVTAKNLPQFNAEAIDFNRFHAFMGLHFRKMKYINPYVIFTAGISSEYNYSGLAYETLSKVNQLSSTIKFGVALEYKNLRISFENGGGTMGTGHVENNTAISYAFNAIPAPTPLSDFTVTAGLHNYFRHVGPYRGEVDYPGFDFTYQYEKDNKKMEKNVGIFFTDYIMSTGVFNFGKGWYLDGDHKIFDYINIIPGYQVLIWAEGWPDVILPAASIGLEIAPRLWNFVPFIKTRTLFTMSEFKYPVVGTTYSVGIGFDF